MLTQRILTVLTIALLTVLTKQSISQTSQKELPEYPTGSESQLQMLPNPNSNQAQQEFERRRLELRRNSQSMNNTSRINPEERIRQMQKMAQEQEELSMRQALGVDERQWKIIKPGIDKVKYYKEQASVNIGLPINSSFSSSSGSSGVQSFAGSFQVGFTGGFNGSSMTDLNQKNQTLTKGEKICRELQALLDSQSVSGQTTSSQEAIKTKIAELQQVRIEAKKQLEKAQEELKKVLNLQQQARLVLMGVLD